jgi:precorrin-2 methylase
MKYINVVGYGVNAVEHLTLEAIMVLERSEVVLALATNEEINVLRRYCLKIVSITSLYKYLLKFYLPTKKITMIQSQSLNSTNTQLTEAKLEGIDLLLYDVNFSCSLFTQGETKNNPVNDAFYGFLTSKS